MVEKCDEMKYSKIKHNAIRYVFILNRKLSGSFVNWYINPTAQIIKKLKLKDVKNNNISKGNLFISGSYIIGNVYQHVSWMNYDNIITTISQFEHYLSCKRKQSFYRLITP